MADFAIGGSFHKSERSLVRAVGLTNPCRYFATRDGAGFITLPTLDDGAYYLEMQGVRQAGFQVDDSEQEFRLFGDGGWFDSVTTGSKLRASMQTYFMKNIELPSGQVCPEFRGDYSEDFALIERTRYDKDFEIYFEILKEMGRADGDSGNFIYDFMGVNAVVRNYRESGSPEGLTEVSFDMMSRGRPVFGRYDAGSTPLAYGGVQSSLLSTAPSSGTRRYAVVPANNAAAVAVAVSPTVTYTTDGTTAMQYLTLGMGGAGFRLEVASTGIQVPAAVTLGGGGSNVVTINPTSNLPDATIYNLIVRDGAVLQSVDASGAPSAVGVRKPLAGFRTSFAVLD